jgi:hypothetical protein
VITFIPFILPTFKIKTPILKMVKQVFELLTTMNN